MIYKLMNLGVTGELNVSFMKHDHKSWYKKGTAVVSCVKFYIYPAKICWDLHSCQYGSDHSDLEVFN